jgi:uncharacterized protein (TIGR02594 family)
MDFYTLAQRFYGLREIAGNENNGFIQWAHSLCGLDPDTPDEVPWCSSFLNAIAWMLRLPRSKSARARSWLAVGLPVNLLHAREGDVVILKRGNSDAGPEVLDAPGHVGLFAGIEDKKILVLGGNQSDAVNVKPFSIASVLGIRRLTA